MKRIMTLFSLTLLYACTQAQQEIPLYEGAIPNSKETPNEESSATDQNGILRISKVSRPTLTIYPAPAKKATGTAVIICPGGGYSILAAGHEGSEVARRFNDMGITAFVLKYRLPDDATMPNKEIGPLQDAQQAIRLVREHAGEWGVNPHKIGLMGFSAGGHLASTAGTHFQQVYIPNPDGTSLRPDFLLLIYPVISFTDSLTHMGSRTRLLGEHPAYEKIISYSNDLQVNAHTPPTFLVHAKDDKVVPVQNSLHFYDALKKNRVPAELYLYEKGGHGFGMHNRTSDVDWMALVQTWLQKQGWLKK